MIGKETASVSGGTSTRVDDLSSGVKKLKFVKRRYWSCFEE